MGPFATGHSHCHAPLYLIGMNTDTHTFDLRAKFQPPKAKTVERPIALLKTLGVIHLNVKQFTHTHTHTHRAEQRNGS